MRPQTTVSREYSSPHLTSYRHAIHTLTSLLAPKIDGLAENLGKGVRAVTAGAGAAGQLLLLQQKQLIAQTREVDWGAAGFTDKERNDDEIAAGPLEGAQLQKLTPDFTFDYTTKTGSF